MHAPFSSLFKSCPKALIDKASTPNNNSFFIVRILSKIEKHEYKVQSTKGEPVGFGV